MPRRHGRDLALRTLSAVLVTPPSGEPLVAVSMYAQWVRTNVDTLSGFEAKGRNSAMTDEKRVDL